MKLIKWIIDLVKFSVYGGGFIFALKYKLGIAKESKDFSASNKEVDNNEHITSNK